MPYRALADLVLLAHAAFVAFVVLGGLVVLRRPAWAWIHADDGLARQGEHAACRQTNVAQAEQTDRIRGHQKSEVRNQATLAAVARSS